MDFIYGNIGSKNIFEKIKKTKKIYIETGAYRGAGVDWAVNHFDNVHSIELSKHRYERCAEKFKNNSKAKIHFGDSRTKLPEILESTNEACFIMLDAHGDINDTGPNPLYVELESIKKNSIKNHVILIDDVRRIGDKSDPCWGKVDIEKLKELLYDINNEYNIFEYKDTLIASLLEDLNETIKVAVLCRGKSLGGLEFLPKNIDLYILVNRFGDELEIDEVGSHLEGKIIYQVLSRLHDEADGMIQRRHYSKYNIKKMIQPYTIHMKRPDDFSDGNNRFYKFIDDKFYFCGEGNPIHAEWLGDHHIEYMDNYQSRYPHHYPSSGNAAIGYAALDIKPNELYIIGMDFYEADYLADGGPGGAEDTHRMKESLSRLIDKNKDIKFTILTCGDYKEEKINLEVIKLEDV